MRAIIRYQRKFDTVVRNYSLYGTSNGERWLLSLMDAEPVVFDVGFHSGSSTIEILRMRPRARVVAFDPSRSALEEYRTNFAGDARVTFHNIGLSDKPGESEFYDYQNQCNSLARRRDIPPTSPAIYSVPIGTLDSFCSEQRVGHINLLKIDAEGFDLNVLEGARELLSGQQVDIFLFEFGGGWSAQKRYLWEADEFVQPFEYSLFHLFNGFLCPLRYDSTIDSCNTLPAMYVGISNRRMSRGDIATRDYRF